MLQHFNRLPKLQKHLHSKRVMAIPLSQLRLLLKKMVTPLPQLRSSLMMTIQITKLSKPILRPLQDIKKGLVILIYKGVRESQLGRRTEFPSLMTSLRILILSFRPNPWHQAKFRKAVIASIGYVGWVINPVRAPYNTSPDRFRGPVTACVSAAIPT